MASQFQVTSESDISTDKVMEVIERVGLQDFLHALPDGLNSQVLENGSNLSGGQLRRYDSYEQVALDL